MFLILNIFWFWRTVKSAFFWLYLWQLKDYHIGRFADHFRTTKGRRLVFNFSHLLKIILIVLFVFAQQWFFYWLAAMFLIYLAESVVFARNIFAKNVKMPKTTAKTLALYASVFGALCLLLISASVNFAESWQPAVLLALDIFLPMIVSGIVLAVQPLAVFAQNRMIKKASQKMEEIADAGKLTVIAITGSYGKTSTKEFLATILESKFKVLKTKEHQNSEVGVARAILDDLDKTHQVFIAEVGAYNKGKVKQVCAMLKPKIGIVTGVNEQHMALFGSLENLLSAEGGRELAESLPKDGLLILNGGNKYCLDLYKKSGYLPASSKKVYGVGRSKVNSDIFAESVAVHKNYISFLAVEKTGSVAPFEATVLGGHNAQNILAAAAAARRLGMSMEEIAKACENIRPEQAGMAIKTGKNGIYVIDSSYSSNPDGAAADLDYLNVFTGKKVVVMPCMIELGPKSAELHRNIGRKIGKVCDVAVITTKERFNDIKAGAVEAGMEPAKVLLCDRPDDIFSAITLYCKSGDAVLLEGRVPAGLIKLLTE